MKTYLIKLKSGLNCELEAENEKSLFEKINSDNYEILPVRGNRSEKIKRENIDKIIEKDPRKK